MKKISQLIILLSFSISVNVFCQKEDTTIYIVVDSVPAFHYKDCKDTRKCVDLFLMEHLKWPGQADGAGRVYIQCVVEKDGKLSNIEVICGFDEDFDNASLDGVKLMPAWIPGKKDGKIVRTQIVFPVTWVLN